ncbi:PREDICTED: uncharacterized protein At4g17910-like [Nicrophorus vespilloides]|uniref:Phosphatidylinositol-glycan biosynthesis class W protein n=1 Tax=Nicrophorus vespilloides TaxID=110193 RepID=A0ABM1N5H4_NICVS|nr:PREDICTED: uncharacterized protein At4g17910-like [Nicrophorus vespilloides]XP_017782083.1 PREDICTED: uncharacterized protein At4g17910-like [Nicrophorus vespilloides]
MKNYQVCFAEDIFLTNWSTIPHWDHAHDALETLSVILPSFLLTYISVNVSSALFSRKDYVKRFVLDLFAITLPVILMTTVLFPYVDKVSLGLALLSVGLCFGTRGMINAFREVVKDDGSDLGRKSFVTNARSTINVLTAVAILGIDFKLFPNQFHKTKKYGISLMDVGVGLYVYANGIVAPEIRGHKGTLLKTILNVLPLLVIGVLRFVITHEIDYHVSVTEYGVHWNFFITLAVTKLVSALIMLPIRNSFTSCAILGFAVLGLHQAGLYWVLEDWVFSGAARSNFLEANREGVVSSIGYVGLYFLSVAFGFVLHGRNKQKTRLLGELFSCVLFVAVCTVLLHSWFNISRCLANSTYCLWVLFIGVLMTTLYYFLENFLRFFYTNVENVIHVPFIFDAINYNGLTFFLVANLLTGFVNIVFKTKSITDPYSLLILTIYMTVTNFVVCLLHVKKIKLKL